MVKICKCCSNVNIELLTEVVDASKIEYGCIDHCGEYTDKVFGIIDGELVAVESQEAFVALVK